MHKREKLLTKTGRSLKDGDKEKKLTIETKDGKTLINGKPASEYKGDDVNVIKQKFRIDKNALFTPGAGNFHFFENGDGEKKAFLGVTTEKVDDGAKITNVSKGSAADKAGLKEGDVITKIGNKKITAPDELRDAVTSYKPKDDITVSYKRDGKNGDVKATLGNMNYANTFSFNENAITNRDFNLKMPGIENLPGHPLAMTWGYNHGRLGVRIEDADNEGGAKVIDVYDESAAAKAGLKENDIITEVNGKKVKDVNEIKKELADGKDKSSYNIKVKRNGADMNFEIKIPKKINKADL